MLIPYITASYIIHLGSILGTGINTQLVVVEWLRKIWTEMVKFGLSRDFPNYKPTGQRPATFPLSLLTNGPVVVWI
jgi:hypothetical protein